MIRVPPFIYGKQVFAVFRISLSAAFSLPPLFQAERFLATFLIMVQKSQCSIVFIWLGFLPNPGSLVPRPTWMTGLVPERERGGKPQAHIAGSQLTHQQLHWSTRLKPASDIHLLG